MPWEVFNILFISISILIPTLSCDPSFLITQRVCVCVCVLTDISGALGDGQVGARTPGSALVTLLAAATVRPSGVVFTLAAQLLFVKHTAVGVKVALAPVKSGREREGS